MDEYTKVRNKLVHLETQLELRFSKLTDNITHAQEPLAQDFAEQATQLENSEVVDFLGNFTRNELIQIKQAIIRLDSGDYGVCVQCGQDISPERLAALPFVDKCIGCAKRAEQR